MGENCHTCIFRYLTSTDEEYEYICNECNPGVPEESHWKGGKPKRAAKQ